MQGWQEPRLPDFAIPAEATYNLEIIGNPHVQHGTETPLPDAPALRAAAYRMPYAQRGHGNYLHMYVHITYV